MNVDVLYGVDMTQDPSIAHCAQYVLELGSKEAAAVSSFCALYCEENRALHCVLNVDPPAGLPAIVGKVCVYKYYMHTLHVFSSARVKNLW